MTEEHFFLDSLGGENYNVLEGDNSVILTLRRTSHAQADEIQKALEYAYTAGSNKAGSFQDGFEHGAAVGIREAREESYDEGYAAGRREYHEELWSRGTDVEYTELVGALEEDA